MKKGITYGELLFGKKEHKKQMRRVKQMDKKVYCKDCKYCKNEWTKFPFKEYCLIFFVLMSPCDEYRRKWWKVWV